MLKIRLRTVASRCKLQLRPNHESLSCSLLLGLLTPGCQVSLDGLQFSEDKSSCCRLILSKCDQDV